MKLETKFFLILVLLSLVLSAGIIIPGYIKIRNFELQEAIDNLVNTNSFINKEIQRNHEVLLKAGVAELPDYIKASHHQLLSRISSSNSSNRLNIIIISQSNKVLLANNTILNLSEHTQLIPDKNVYGSNLELLIPILTSTKSEGFNVLETDNYKWHSVISYDNEWNWKIITTMSQQDVYHESWTYLRFVLAINFIVFLFVLIIYGLLTRQIRKRIQTIASHLTEYSRGNYKNRIQIQSSDEIGIVQKHVNLMIDKIEKAIDAREKYETELNIAILKTKEANDAKTKFLASMSHEIRTPINAIVGFTEQLSLTQLNESQSRYVDNILYAGENLRKTANDILDLKKIEEGLIKFASEPFNLKQQIHSTVDLFSLEASSKNLRIVCEVSDDFPENVAGDSLRCSQIIANLIQNAVKFTDKGSVTINALKIKEEIHEVTVKIEVRDTGKGISESEKGFIFDAFSQSNQHTSTNNGLGLGLSIANDIVNAMGGDISVSDNTPQGSCFTVILPFKKLKTIKRLQVVNHEKLIEKLKSMHILIAEDDPLNQEYLSVLLNRYNAKLTFVENGQQAIDQLQNKNFDLVLMDIQMPVLNGEEAILKIRQRQNINKNNIPIIALTANAYPDDVKRYIKIGASACVAKPFDSEKLLTGINQALSCSSQTVDSNAE